MGILKVTEERSRIRSWIRIRQSEVLIGGSVSTPKCHGSVTPIIRVQRNQCREPGLFTLMRMWMFRFRIRIRNPGVAYQAGPDSAGREHEDPVVGRNGPPCRVLTSWIRIRIRNPAVAYQAGPDGAGREHEDPVVGQNGAPPSCFDLLDPDPDPKPCSCLPSWP